MRTRLVGGTVVAMVSTLAFAAPASARAGAFQAPVYAGDFPDPSVIVSDDTYWAYGTGSAGLNLQVMSSADLIHWTAPSDPLPELPGWASPGRTWAPGVIQLGGTFVMYYTVRDTALGIQCLSVATSDTPAGPFRDGSSAPFICQAANGGSIDPQPYRDPVSGRLYLFWKSDDNAIGQNTHLWAQELARDGLSLAPGSQPSLLLSESLPWQSPSVEGPAVLRFGEVYYLFYGANNYDTASSGIGYATSRSILGPYRNRSLVGPWLGTRGNAQGPQGPSLFTDGSGATRLAFAAWNGKVGYRRGGARSLWIATISFGLLNRLTAGLIGPPSAI